MSFLETLDRARAHLQKQGRLSLRALRREFDLGDEALEELVEELVDVQQVATREGSVLSWMGAATAPSTVRPSAPPEPARDPRSYTPKHLADKILQSKSALEGERKQVTVLFADVKGSMELAEQVDAERWHHILERFFEILTEGVHRFEGTVNQYTGDGVMALFGAPISHEDHAQRACYAALRLREELRRYSDELRLDQGLDFAFRMGINSGDVVVGKIGDDLRMDYTAQGHTVGLAARMEAVAPPNGVCISQATAGLVGGYVSLRDLGASNIKGATEPVNVFELEGMGEIQSRFDLSRSRGLTRFVGRDDDMAVLEQALEQARAGNGQVVGVVAEAGTGKSRLCFELLERCRASGLSVLQGTGVAHGKNIPLLPILEIFRQYFGIGERDDDRAAREKIAGRLLLIDEGFREFLPVVFDFLAVPDTERPAPPMDPDARQRQLFGVMRKLIEQRENTQVTLVEDLHWIDAGSEAWLEQMVDAATGSNTLLVVNFRPEYHAAWMQKSWYRQLPLLPLGPEAIRELLDDLLGNDPSTVGLADAVHERTAGNPFFAEEIIQTLIESGTLEGSRGAYRLVTQVENLEVPRTVQSVLATRIDRLGESEKQVLQAASVIGKEFAEPILAAVLDWPERELENALVSLKNAEFIYEQSLFPVAEYAFKHPLTQEVALHSQLRERRALTHAAVAAALEAAHPDKRDENSALLAHHCEEAGCALEAARWHRRAAEWLAANSSADSIAHWRRVYELAGTEPEDREAMALSSVAIPMLLSFAWRVGLTEQECERLADQGRELAARAGDRRLLFDVEFGLTVAISLCGNLREAVEPSRRCVELANELGDLETRVLADDAAGEIIWFSGRYAEALRAWEQLQELTNADRSIGAAQTGFSRFAWSIARQGYCLAEMGRPQEAAGRYETADRLLRERGELDPLSILSGFRTTQAWLLGLTDVAFLHAHQALEYADKTGSPFSRLYALSSLGLAHLSKGSPTAAREMLDEAVALCRERHIMRQYFAFTLGSHAETYLQTGDLEQALALGEEATAYARRAGTASYELRAELVVAATRIARAESHKAAKSLERCEALVKSTHAAAFGPFVTEQRARLAASAGKDATELLRQAQRQFKGLGATGYAERLARELSPPT